MKACDIIFRDFTRWNWHRFIKNGCRDFNGPVPPSLMMNKIIKLTRW